MFRPERKHLVEARDRINTVKLQALLIQTCTLPCRFSSNV
jgi:hypothetical protein